MTEICKAPIIFDGGEHGRECDSRVFKRDPEVDVCINCYSYNGESVTEESIRPHRHTEFGTTYGEMGAKVRAKFIGIMCENGHIYT